MDDPVDTSAFDLSRIAEDNEDAYEAAYDKMVALAFKAASGAIESGNMELLQAILCAAHGVVWYDNSVLSVLACKSGSWDAVSVLDLGQGFDPCAHCFEPLMVLARNCDATLFTNVIRSPHFGASRCNRSVYTRLLHVCGSEDMVACVAAAAAEHGHSLSWTTRGPPGRVVCWTVDPEFGNVVVPHTGHTVFDNLPGTLISRLKIPVDVLGGLVGEFIYGHQLGKAWARPSE